MINGYINFPSELSAIDSFLVERKIPGIYKKMANIVNANKPLVGKFSLTHPYPISSIFFPSAYYRGTTIQVAFALGDTFLTLMIKEDDTVATVMG